MIPAPADPGEATAHIERGEVFAVADAPLAEVEASVEDAPAPTSHAGALYALGGYLLGGVLALGVLAILGCAAAAAWAVPISGGTADEASAGWCACPRERP